mgnify:CR=1 FL=1
MDEKRLALFREINQSEFDFNSLVGSKAYGTLCGIKVNIDRIIRDVTKTSVIAVSGTMVIQGVKIRGVWDPFGNIIECKKTLNLLSPKSFTSCLDSMFDGVPESLFQLVNIEELGESSINDKK